MTASPARIAHDSECLSRSSTVVHGGVVYCAECGGAGGLLPTFTTRLDLTSAQCSIIVSELARRFRSERLLAAHFPSSHEANMAAIGEIVALMPDTHACGVGGVGRGGGSVRKVFEVVSLPLATGFEVAGEVVASVKLDGVAGCYVTLWPLGSADDWCEVRCHDRPEALALAEFHACHCARLAAVEARS